MSKRDRPEPRKLPRQTRAKATVDALVIAATRILVKDGYDGANVNVIAELAGVSIGSLYQYFPSKDALVAEVVRRHAEAMVAAFSVDLVELAFLPMPDACRGVVRRALAAYAVDPALRKVIAEDVPNLVVFARSRDFDETLAEMLRGYLRFHPELIRPTNVDLAVKILTTAVEAVFVRVTVDEPALLGTDELVDELTALIVGYLSRQQSDPLG